MRTQGGSVENVAGENWIMESWVVRRATQAVEKLEITDQLSRL